MDFLNLLIPKEKIVGIEIGEQKLRMLRLEKDSFGNINVLGKSEADLPEGTIVFGRVADKEKLSQSIELLKNNFKPRRGFSQFAIVTISQNGVYSDILELPKNLREDQIIEAVSFNAANSLPLPLSKCYIDWQLIEEGDNKNKMLISIIPKEIADAFIAVLSENGFKLIAMEPSSLSIARAANIPADPILFFHLTDDGITSIIYNQRKTYFSQFELWEEASGGKDIKTLTDLKKLLKNKCVKLINYFSFQQSSIKIKKILLMSEGFDADKIIKNIDFSYLPVIKAESGASSVKNFDWISVAGAAMRGFIPRSDDRAISLLPVGTEKLYDQQKTSSFLKSILVAVAALSIFYISVFALTFVFISYTGSVISKQMEVRSRIAIPAEYAKIEEEAREFNDYIKELSIFYPRVRKNYFSVLENINQVDSPGIFLTNASFNSASDSISITGVASTRESLNAFRSKAEKSLFFRDAKVSVQNIAQRSNIPFNIILQPK